MTSISLITGGSRGLGRNTAISIARRGGDVILTYQTGKGNAEAVVAEIEALGRKAVALPLDTGKVSSFGAFVDAIEGKRPDCPFPSLFRQSTAAKPQSILHVASSTSHSSLAS